MAKTRTVTPEKLADAIQQELTLYGEGVAERVNTAGKTAAEKLRKLTKATAPVASGDFRKHIAIKEVDSGHGTKKYIWHVKAPDHRLTHLLVHGHATKTGGRTKADPFLKNALETVLPEYEQAVKEAVQND